MLTAFLFLWSPSLLPKSDASTGTKAAHCWQALCELFVLRFGAAMRMNLPPIAVVSCYQRTGKPAWGSQLLGPR